MRIHVDAGFGAICDDRFGMCHYQLRDPASALAHLESSISSGRNYQYDQFVTGCAASGNGFIGCKLLTIMRISSCNKNCQANESEAALAGSDVKRQLGSSRQRE